MSDHDPDTWKSRVSKGVGLFLIGTAAVAMIFWLLIVIPDAALSRPGSFRIGPFSGSGLRDALMATPVFAALVGSQALLGIGLLKNRPWVRWYGLMVVALGFLMGSVGLDGTSNSLLMLAVPLIAMLPAAILGWQRIKRSREPVEMGAESQDQALPRS